MPPGHHALPSPPDARASTDNASPEGLPSALAELGGNAIDVAPFLAWWWSDRSSPPTTGVAFGFASLAQRLIIGGTVALSGVIARFVRRNGTPGPAPAPT